MNEQAKHIDYEKFAKYLADSDETNPASLKAKEVDAWQSSVKTWKLLEEMKEIEQFDEDKAWSKLYKRFEQDDLLPEQEKQLNKLQAKTWIAAAASVIILIGSISALLLTDKTSGFSTTRVVNNNVPPMEHVFPDGSVVSLNYGAKIEYSRKFGQNHRKLQLKGEAFFDVERNENLPFEISVNNAMVTVLGTSFNIKSKNNTVEVVVKSGKVKLAKQFELKSAIILEKDDRGTLINNNLSKAINEHANYLSWLNKQLVFKEVPLGEAILDINNAFHADISLGDSSLNDVLITTNFTNSNLNDVLASIALAFNLNVERSGKKYILELN